MAVQSGAIWCQDERDFCTFIGNITLLIENSLNTGTVQTRTYMGGRVADPDLFAGSGSFPPDPDPSLAI